jgi:flagellar hook-length control protein FliK
MPNVTFTPSLLPGFTENPAVPATNPSTGSSAGEGIKGNLSTQKSTGLAGAQDAPDSFGQIMTNTLTKKSAKVAPEAAGAGSEQPLSNQEIAIIAALNNAMGVPLLNPSVQPEETLGDVTESVASVELDATLPTCQVSSLEPVFPGNSQQAATFANLTSPVLPDDQGQTRALPSSETLPFSDVVSQQQTMVMFDETAAQNLSQDAIPLPEAEAFIPATPAPTLLPAEMAAGVAPLQSPTTVVSSAPAFIPLSGISGMLKNAGKMATAGKAEEASRVKTTTAESGPFFAEMVQGSVETQAESSVSWVGFQGQGKSAGMIGLNPVNLGISSQQSVQLSLQTTPNPTDGANSRADAQETATVEKPHIIDLPVLQSRFSIQKSNSNKSETEGFQMPLSAQPAVVPEQTHKATAEATQQVSREPVFSQIIEHARVMVDNGQSQMELTLKPEHLGKLQLKVELENHLITAKFVAESDQVKQIIETNLGQLRDSLQQNGVRVDSLTVVVGRESGSNAFEQFAEQQHQQQNPGYEGTYAHRETDDPSFSEALQPVVELDSMINLIA